MRKMQITMTNGYSIPTPSIYVTVPGYVAFGCSASVSYHWVGFSSSLRVSLSGIDKLIYHYIIVSLKESETKIVIRIGIHIIA